MEHKFWLRINFKGGNMDRFFIDYPKMHHFIEKHGVKDTDIVFIKTRKELIRE